MKFLSHSSRKTLATCSLLLSMAAASFAQYPLSKVPELKIEGDKVTGFTFRNISVPDLLRIYEKLAGMPVVSDTSVQGNLSLETDIPLSKAAAKELIEISLLINGFAVVKREKEIIVLGPGKPTRSVSIPVYFDEKSIPAGESVITFVFDLKHADPVELSNILNQYLATGQPYTCFFALPGGQRLLVTETASTIRNILPLIRKLDVEKLPRSVPDDERANLPLTTPASRQTP